MGFSKILADVKSAIVGSKNYGLELTAFEGKTYFLDLEFLLENDEEFFQPFNENGLPMKRFVVAGDVILPTRMAAYGFAHYNRWILRSDSVSEAKFWLTVEWFMSASNGVWPYNFQYEELSAPWISCMAQGEGISLLTRAYKHSGEAKYLEQAKLACVPILQTIEQGGVRSKIDDKHTFLEEYPLPIPKHTLNGFMYAMIGLYELNELAPEVSEIVGLSSLTVTLEKLVNRWDTGYWTTYDLHKAKKGRMNLATVYYHRLHTSQVTFLGHLADSTILHETGAKWSKYYDSVINRLRALVGKVAYRIVAPAGKK